MSFSINDPRAPGLSRKPRCAVTVNGIPLTGVLSVEVTNASHFAADAYRVEAAVSGLPPQLGPAYFSSSADDRVAISVSVDDSSPQPLITGQVDDVDYDPVRRTLTLSGRDLSGSLIDARTTEKFQNLRSHEIAQQLALRHGLDSDVQATSTLAGAYYEIDHAALSREQPEWDLLVYLAEREGFDVWVSGQTLFFKPPPVETAPPYLLLWSQPGDGSFASNADGLQLRRSQTLARDVIVIVKSWNQKQQKGFSVKYKASQAKRSQRVGGEAQTYTFVRPNLSRDQAVQLAQAKAREITRHERVLTASLPGDNALTTRAMVRLAGTNTDWDQLYYPETVTRRLSMQEGYRMELRAKNHSTLDEVAL
jgi:phage protein D